MEEQGSDPKEKDDINMEEMDRERVYANDWTDQTAGILERWIEKSKTETKRHMDAAKKKRWCGRALSVPMIVFGAVASSLSFFASASAPECPGTDRTTTIQISASVFTTLSAVLGSIIGVYKFEMGCQRHLNTAARFNNLTKQAQLQLYLPAHRKSDIEVTLTSISDQFSEIVNSAPLT